MSTAGGVWLALERARRVKAEVCQLFVKNNMQWLGKPHTPEVLRLFQEQRTGPGPGIVFGHAGYLINLGAPASRNRDLSLQSLTQEIELASALKLPFLVLHPGAHLGAGEEQGLKQTAAGLSEVFRATKTSGVCIALENTAGQGTCLGRPLEHLAVLYDSVTRPERLGVCIDTAHLFAAGYDIRSPAGWDEAIAAVSRLVGREEILAFHLNDSKTELGSRVDRHAHIGKGRIGKAAFRHIVNDPRFVGHPGCIETPKSEDLHEDMENLRLLRSLVSRRRPATLLGKPTTR